MKPSVIACVGCVALLWFCASSGRSQPADSQPAPPERPADFKPFQVELTTEQIQAKFSETQMKRAAAELQQIQAVNAAGPWKPTWDSIDKHQVPEWFMDAKLGVFVNWGVHSVPAWDRKRGGAMYPDAYGVAMYVDDLVRAHHAKFWGADFQWDDFVPLFKAEKYDPEAMAVTIPESLQEEKARPCQHAWVFRIPQPEK